MLIAFLALLGVNLIVIVILVALLLIRKRRIKRQPGSFAGAIRAPGRDMEELGPKWKRGYGRWVRDVLVWTKAPLLLRNELVPIDRLANEHSARPGEVKRLGDEPVVVEFESDGAKVEVAAKAEHRDLVSGGRTLHPATPAS
jgi:hypothetical protein